MTERQRHRSILITITCSAILVLLRNLYGDSYTHGFKSYYVAWDYGWPFVFVTRYNATSLHFNEYGHIDAFLALWDETLAVSRDPPVNRFLAVGKCESNFFVGTALVTLMGVAAAVRPLPVWQFRLKTLLACPLWLLGYKFSMHFSLSEVTMLLNWCIHLGIICSVLEIWRHRATLHGALPSSR